MVNFLIKKCSFQNARLFHFVSLKGVDEKYFFDLP